jgi:hypothetical protein
MSSVSSGGKIRRAARAASDGSARKARWVFTTARTAAAASPGRSAISLSEATSAGNV